MSATDARRERALLQRRALAVFDAALDVADDERAAFVATQCAGDVALANEVRALLSAAGMTNGILDVAPPGVGAGLLSPVREALAGEYDVVREIGRGGMATVLLARERKHDRDVVIKVLDPSLAHLFGAERFLREVRIAATLAHPHIVPLIDSGDAGGFLYYVMPWMDGETVRERLRRETPPLAESVSILRDVAGALAFAHDGGIVHRDIKPENVLLTGAHAYLLDFGIAKLLDDTSASSSITLPGFPIGTRRYMAPEQAFADTVDARTDIYAWGLLGAELLTGTPLPPGEAEQVAAAALSSPSNVSAALVALVLECLRTMPERRPASMHVVIARLDALRSGAHDAVRDGGPDAARASAAAAANGRTRRTVTAAVVVGAMALGALWFATSRSRSLNATAGDAATATAFAEPVAATVLRNETGDTSLAVIGRYAGDWITDGLQRMGTARIVAWPEALVASDQATASGRPLVATVFEQTGAGTVVTGTYYRMKDSLRLQAQLNDARTGRVVSVLAPIVVPLDRPEAAVAQLRDRVMGAVAAARDDRVASVPGVTRNPPSFSAYQAFDQAFDRFLAQRYGEALAGFRTAFARDTTFTLALLLGARAAWNEDEFAVAETLVTRANAQSRELGVYHEASLRYIEALLRGDGKVARAAVQRASAIAPNSRAGFDHAASMLNAGYAREAQAQLLRMDPDRGEMRGWSPYWTQRAHVAHLLGDNAAALVAAREMARRYPERRVAQSLEARALSAAGDVRRLDSALAAWDSLPANTYWSQGAAMVVAAEELMRRDNVRDGTRYGSRAVAWLSNRLVATPTDRAHRYWLGSALYDLGRFDEARPYFEGLATEFPDRTRYRGLAAVVAARRGDFVAADRWLGVPPPRDSGEHLAFRARIAAIRGDREAAISLLTDALDHGVEAYPWMPGTAFRDFATIAKDPRARLLLAGR